MALKAVIFDYGMVLSTAQEPQALAALKQITRLNDQAFDDHYWRHRHRYDLGDLNGTTFWQQIATDAALELTPAQIEQLIENDVLMWSTLNEAMLLWVQAVQDAGFKTAILSNMGEELLGYMRQEFGWLGRFDHHTWSCELRIAKPDPAIYRYTCEKLGVIPEDALFLDDKPENIAAAESIGLQAILFTNVEALQAELLNRGLLGTLPSPIIPVLR
ncbi:HAD family phosphatase [Acidipila sp. EB88]|uniref:HAD family hydrolase n=1 Tax=Acidipila sp. EB88 TaxID=2305226 RepID=UPI000F5F27F9|nr:HAD family phosphatase [Acidipila sp. EB88]RRA49497.1 HAD family phosphatase [Acidipila sp. EB88]